MAQSKDQVTKAGKLVWQGDKGAIQERILNEGTVIVVGRDPSSDILLSNKLVSKRHALFYWEGDKCVITDQDSANGTLVNGKRINAETTLQDGDRIEIGDTVISYYFLGDRMVEGMKTMPLSAPESEAKSAATVRAEEETRAEPPAESKTTPEPAKEAKGQAQVENMPTMIVSATVSEAEKPKTAPEPSPPLTPRTTVPYPGAAEQASQKSNQVQNSAAAGAGAQGAGTGEGEGVDLFAALLEQTRVSHASAQAVQQRWLAVRGKLEEIVDRLDKNAPRMTELTEKVNEASLIDLLDKLTNTPTDVTLLIQMGTHSALLSRLIKAYYNQEGMINLIKDELQAELQQSSK